MVHEHKTAVQGSPWVMVADHARVRLFVADVPQGPLVEMQGLSNPDARLHEGDLVSDAGGSLVHGRRGVHGGNHTAGDEDSSKHHVTDAFARSAAKALQIAHQSGVMSRVYLIAEPGFLGLLRAHLDKVTAQVVSGEIGRRLTDLTSAQIRDHLPAIL